MKPFRKSVKVILLNEKDELLLMCADDPNITNENGEYGGRFWFCTGGQIEEGETIEEAAIRELYEETSLLKEEIELGPVVWYGEFDLNLQGVLTHLMQTFIVAKTKKKEVGFNILDEWEKKSALKMAWFSIDDIKNSKDVIYPILLPKYLPDIINKKYPQKPIKIDLGKQKES